MFISRTNQSMLPGASPVNLPDNHAQIEYIMMYEENESFSADRKIPREITVSISHDQLVYVVALHKNMR